MPPKGLESRHQQELIRRGLSPEFAEKSGVKSVADNEARNIGFLPSIPKDQQKQGLQGILFHYRKNGNDEAIYRLKPDQVFTIDGKHAKYLSRVGDPPKIFLPHTTLEEHKSNPRIQIFLTEGEFKALALAEKICPIASRPTCVIGLQGVNGGWHRDKITVTLPNGTKETRKEGHAHLIDDLESWEWKKRVVYIVFDSDVGTKQHAQEFKRSPRSGAIGAEYTIAQLLRGKGADVRIVEIPHTIGHEKLGIDDYILQYGAHAALKLIYNNWLIDRDINKILYKGDPAAFIFQSAKDIIRNRPAKPPFVIKDLLPEGGVMVIAAAPKVGKSSIALNAGLAVANGTKFLDMFDVIKGRAAYIQTEIPAWAMGERLSKMGEIPESLTVLTPNRMQLNFWEDDGFNKKRDTGNREIVNSLVASLQSQAVNLVIFDPYRHFTSLNENNVEHVTHMFEVYRAIATHLRAGVIIVHHHRKIQRAQVRYEGAEDMSGSGAFFGEPDAILSIYQSIASDDTRRFKLVFDTRHSEKIDPYELVRLDGDNCMLWRAEPWIDYTRSGKIPTIEKVFQIVQEDGPVGYEPIMRKLNKSKSGVLGYLRQLEDKHKIVQKGNLYEVDFGD